MLIDLWVERNRIITLKLKNASHCATSCGSQSYTQCPRSITLHSQLARITLRQLISWMHDTEPQLSTMPAMGKITDAKCTMLTILTHG